MKMSCLEYALLLFLENITIAEFVNGSFGLVKTNSQKMETWIILKNV